MNDMPGDPARPDQVLEALPFPVWSYDAGHRLVYANAVARETFGGAASPVPLGASLENMLAVAAHRGLLGRGAPEELVRTFLGQDRSRPQQRLVRQLSGRVADLRSVPLPGGGFASIALNVTALADAVAEAEALTRRLEDVLHRLHAGLAVYDSDHRMVLNNASYERLLGLPRGLLPAGTTYGDLLGELARRGEFANTDPQALLAQRAGIDRSRPYRHERERPNGRFLQFESQPVAEGGWLVEVTDITAVKRAEEEVRGRAALLHGVLEALPLGVMVVGPDMRVRLFNSRSQDFFDGTGLRVGEHREELARRRAEGGHYGPGDPAELARTNLTPVGTGPTLRQRRRPDGGVIEVRSAPTPDGGYVQVLADITALHQAQAEATERAALMQLMLDSMRHGIALFDRDRRLITANALAARLIGVSPEVMRPGVSLSDLRQRQLEAREFGSVEQAAALIAISDRHDLNEPYRYTRRRPDGTVLDIASDPTPDGGFVRTYIDVTAQAQAEAEARQRAATLQALLDNMQLGITLFGPDRRVVASNALSAAMAGLPAGAIRPGALLEDLTRGQWAANAAGDEELTATLANRALVQDRGHSLRHTRPTADGRLLEVRSDPMPDGGFIVTHQDITPLARAETEARQRAAMLQAALDNMRHGIAMFGPDRRLVMANALAARLTGLPEHLQRPGVTLAELVAAQAASGEFGDAATTTRHVGISAARDTSQPFRYTRERVDGSVIEVVSDPTPDGGFVITYSDVTARARAEAAAAQRARDMQVMQDHMRHGLGMYGPDRVLRTANALFRELCGLSADTVMVGRSYAELVRAQRDAGVFGADAEVAARTEVEMNALDRSQPIRHLRHWPDGRIMEITSEPTEDGGFVVCISDVTALATVQRELQHRADLQQAMLDNIQHGIALYGPDRRLRIANRLAGPGVGLPDLLRRPGDTFEALVEAQRVEGAFGPEPAATQIATAVMQLDRAERHRYLRHLPDGKVIEVASAPTLDGGFVITHSDITLLEQARAEAQHRAGLLQAMLDNVRHGIAVYDADGILVTANELATDYCGLPAGAMVPGTPMERLLRLQFERGALGTGATAVASLAENLARDWHQPRRYQRTDSQGRVLDVTVNPMPDGGYVLGWSDITALLAAQAEAARRAEALAVMMNTMRHGISLYDKDHRLVAANQLVGPLNGTPSGETRIGWTLRALLDEQLALRRVTEAQKQRQLALDRSQPDRAVVSVPGGKVLEIRSDPTPDGGFVMTLTDVTQLAHAEEAARSRATLLQVILDNVRHGLSLYGPDRRLLMANRLAEDLSGVPEGTLQPGRLQDDMITEQYLQGAFGTGREAEEYLARMRARDWLQPMRVQRRDGKGRLIDVVSIPMADGSYLLTRTDVTELVAAHEEAARRGQTLQLILDNTRHAMALFGPDKRLVTFNRLAAELIGLPTDRQSQGLHYDEIIALQVELGTATEEHAAWVRGLDRRQRIRYLRPGLEPGSTIEVGSDPTPDGGFVLTYNDVSPLVRAETAARQRAELLQVTLENMRHGFVKYDAERRLEMVNALALKLHGLPPDSDLVGRREPDIVREIYERGEVDEAAWQGSLHADITTHRQTVRTRPNGEVVLFTANPTPDGGYVVTVSDISDLMSAQTAASHRAAVLQVMLDNIRHGICYYGPDRRVIAANALAARLGGHEPADLSPGVLLDDLIHDQLRKGAVPPHAVGIATQALALDRSKPAQHVRPTGDGRVLEVTSDPTPDGGFVVTSTDITRLAEAEAVAQSRAAVLQVMLDNIRHGIVLFDAERRIVAANPRVRDMLGLPEDTLLVGLHLHDYIRNLARLGVYGSDTEAPWRAEGTIARFDPTQPNRHVRTGPQGQTMEVVSDPTPDGGFVLTYTDVTEDRAVRAELEAARRAAEAANLAKSRFLATMTHELRTPLNAVIGFSEALQTAPNPERSREYLGSIHEAGHHLLSLIDDILDVTRAETTGFQVAEGEVELRPLCESVVRVMRAAATSGQVKLGLELANALPVLRADEVRLRQVLLNLLSNAVKFTPAEGSVTLLAGPAADGALVIRVRDTGIGVRAEDMPRVFQPFSQVDSSLSRRFPGSGLGLYLSRALAEAQGATLTLESGEGQGTTAILRFPPERLLPATPDPAPPPPMFAP